MDDHGHIDEAGVLRIERLLPGPVERVWAYLTESEKRGRWLASGDMDLREGGTVEHVFRHAEITPADDKPPPKYAGGTGEHQFEARITRCDPPRLLAYIWPEKGGDESEVTFELESRGTQVRLAITHRRLKGRDLLISVAAGWHAHLDVLAAKLSGAAPVRFWETHTRLEKAYAERISE